MPSIINSDDGVVSGTSGLKTTGGNDGLLNIQTNGTTAISISSGQRSTFPTTIGVGNATPSTSGSGITFPATQSASTNANTLDDYEEGTFTPTIDGSSSSPTVTYNAQIGYYTRVGQIVTCNFYIEGSSRTGGTGNLTIRGCPFPVIQAKAMGGNALTYQISSGGTQSLYPTFTSDGSNAFYLLASANNGGTWSQIGVTSVTNGLWAIHVCVTYQTNT